VRAAAAEALVPVVGALASMGPEAVEQVGSRRSCTALLPCRLA
jgi:hypothetical protein